MSSRYKMIGNKENNGSISFDAETLVSKELLEALGEKEVIKMVKEVREKIEELIETKREIYGDSDKVDDILGFPNEVYFKDTVTGAVISLESVPVDEVINYSELMLIMNQRCSFLETPILLDTKEKCEELLEAPHIFQFEPVRQVSQIK